MKAMNCRDCIHDGERMSAVECPPSNVAALREALLWVIDRMNAALIDGKMECEETIDKCKSALSAPARNCDKMPDIDNLTMHDLAKSPCKSTLEYASREELLALVRWLLAPAAEQKRRREMKVALQVERHLVAVETDYKPSDTRALFDRLIVEVVRKMDFILNKESEETKPCKH